MLKHGFFPFHIVDMSPWPLYMSYGAFMNLMSILLLINNSPDFLYLSISGIIFSVLSFYGWMRDVCNEGFLQGNHTMLVQSGLKMGMILFIISEVLFFFSFFWSLFYYSITPSVEIYSWPPTGIQSIDPMAAPLLGTLLLISSGASITWSHHSIMENNKKEVLISLIITILLGVMFMIIQYNEYKYCSFTISDSVFGSIFFMSTGFHGFHVIVGTLMLTCCLFRLLLNQFSKTHHLGFEASIWYWHFVDVVWLLLYICAYWWGKM